MTQNGGRRAREGANEYALACVHPAAEKERTEMRNGGWDTLPLPPCVYSFSLSIFASRRSRINVSLRSSSFLPPSNQMLHPSKKKGIRKRKGLEVETKEEWRENSFPSAGEGGGGQSGEVEEGGRAIGKWRKASAFRSPFLFFFLPSFLFQVWDWHFF